MKVLFLFSFLFLMGIHNAFSVYQVEGAGDDPELRKIARVIVKNFGNKAPEGWIIEKRIYGSDRVDLTEQKRNERDIAGIDEINRLLREKGISKILRVERCHNGTVTCNMERHDAMEEGNLHHIYVKTIVPARVPGFTFN